ncbi:MAG: hypothetical protein K8I60_11905 [Anaerolineae bacterium]|nr:hypothetical protein [Anaerolineae bacterium]
MRLSKTPEVLFNLFTQRHDTPPAAGNAALNIRETFLNGLDYLGLVATDKIRFLLRSIR